VERARKELQKRKVVGVVMNGVEEIDQYGSYYSANYNGRTDGKAKGSQV
jgi:hypothetical protein